MDVGLIILEILFGTLLLLFLDIVLSVDNAILIVSTTKDLKGKDRRKAALIGAAGAVLLRLIFIILIYAFLHYVTEIPVFYILSGLLLIYIGWTMTKEKTKKDEEHTASDVMKAIALIIAGDIMMSFDNAFIIAQVVSGFPLGTEWWGYLIEVLIVVVALGISLAIILFASKAITNFMHKHAWLIYVACWLLLSVGIHMALEDQLIVGDKFGGFHPDWWAGYLIAYSGGAVLTGFNWLWRNKNKLSKNNKQKERDQ